MKKTYQIILAKSKEHYYMIFNPSTGSFEPASNDKSIYDFTIVGRELEMLDISKKDYIKQELSEAELHTIITEKYLYDQTRENTFL